MKKAMRHACSFAPMNGYMAVHSIELQEGCMYIDNFLVVPHLTGQSGRAEYSLSGVSL
jgi:hypothetical protein